jgi:hypothetical protein
MRQGERAGGSWKNDRGRDHGHHPNPPSPQLPPPPPSLPPKPYHPFQRPTQAIERETELQAKAEDLAKRNALLMETAKEVKALREENRRLQDETGVLNSVRHVVSATHARTPAAKHSHGWTGATLMPYLACNHQCVESCRRQSLSVAGFPFLSSLSRVGSAAFGGTTDVWQRRPTRFSFHCHTRTRMHTLSRTRRHDGHA